MSKFSFSVTKDFATPTNISILANSITNNIPIQLQTINPYGDAIEIIFVSDLTNEQKSVLANLVSAWDNSTQITYTKVIPIYLRAVGITNTTYQRYGIYGYLGSNIIGEIKKIYIVAHMDNATNYSVKVYDATNSLTIAENTFTNKIDLVLDMGTISNISQTPAVIEIYVKKTGGTANDKVYAENIVFHL